MKPLITVESKAIPFVENNVDTDQLLPKQFLTEITRQGFGKHLLHDVRYLDSNESVLNPDCVLNDPVYAGAEILLAGENFGCGSSREHAPWAIADFGFRVIIAKGFADIFYANCLNNQILPITLPRDVVDDIAMQCRQNPNQLVFVDLSNQQVRFNSDVFSFAIQLHHKQNLITGVDKIGRTLLEENAIAEYEAKALLI
ncbi:3-isopropylmalate dehydratase small subunit [Alteromonas stellipolaris]|uniref:3-isopropylmalate dehydratase small subunit n=1 Tax=Alteromonas stellipolaris TaxID=233316 RepID=UPI001D734013|nr:3-isopropylmalate dehydratase small subunit [Alteromonas stellipolaris]MBZ2162054.1 3-isopropylmalate dehydratase small subunit [Alteromonas stellipolaris]